jgi:hypothetical protein
LAAAAATSEGAGAAESDVGSGAAVVETHSKAAQRNIGRWAEAHCKNTKLSRGVLLHRIDMRYGHNGYGTPKAMVRAAYMIVFRA